MENTIYQPPESDLDPVETLAIPETMRKNIKSGWITAIVHASLLSISILVTIGSDSAKTPVAIWNFLDVALILLMGFGIYKKSRAASTSLMIYYLLTQIYHIVTTGQFTGIVLAVIIASFYFKAMIATYQYHQLKAEYE